MMSLLQHLPAFYIARQFNTKVPLPVNYNLNLTYNCMARCKTCRIYERPKVNELTTGEWRKIFEGMKKSPYWVTLTGGEPFLRDDIVELYYWLCKLCQPRIVNIPTNGQLTERTIDWVWQMKKMYPKTELVVNLSFDHHIPELNDEIRGIKGYTKRAKETLKGLQAMEDSNLFIGIHSAVSVFNVADMTEISTNLRSWLKNPTNYLAEVAEERGELLTVGLPITPNYEQYVRIADSLLSKTGKNRIPSLPNIRQAFRKYYYKDTIANYLKGSNHKLSCYAGYTSAQIAPEGSVWYCCIIAKPIGNLRDYNYRLADVWNSEPAQWLREKVKECKGCPMAAINYLNNLMNPIATAKVIKEAIFSE